MIYLKRIGFGLLIIGIMFAAAFATLIVIALVGMLTQQLTLLPVILFTLLICYLIGRSAFPS